MSAHHDPIYPDVSAVVAGLNRLVDDLSDVQTDARTAVARIMERGTRTGGGHLSRVVTLDAIALQLRWLADDVLHMQSALTGKETRHAN